MKILLLGRRHSVNHWLEDAASALAAAGHEIRVSHVRRPPIPLALERAFWPARGEAMARWVARARPDLVLAIGGFHVPAPILEPLAAVVDRPPLAAWVGDRFDETARPLAGLYDLVGYTDSALLSHARERGFASAGIFLPHAADPSGPWPHSPRRSAKMVFIANPTAHRREVVAGVSAPLALYGPGWRAEARAGFHEVHPRRISTRTLRTLYGAHRAALNIRNEINVLSGLNQRSFDPALGGAAILSDDQPDLALCFEPDREIAVWESVAVLDALYQRVRTDEPWALALAEAGRRRVLAHHTYANRLTSLRNDLNI